MANETAAPNANGHGRTQWGWGSDEQFDAWSFHIAVAVVWTITAMILFVKAMGTWASPPSRRSRCCLSLTVISALCSCFDNVLYLRFGEPTTTDQSQKYPSHLLSYVGSIFMVSALTVFAHAWCDLAIALKSSNTCAGIVRVVRYGYTIVAILHVPMVVLKTLVDSRRFHGISVWASPLIWTAWSFLSTGCAFTLFAILMCRVALNVHQSQRSRGFRVVALLNLCEQLVYDALLGVIGVLFYWGFFWGTAFHDYGQVQAAYYSLYFLLYWIMHAQIWVFFTCVKPDDPVYSAPDLASIAASCAVVGRPAPQTVHGAPQAETFSCGRPDIADGLPTVSHIQLKVATRKVSDPGVPTPFVVGTRPSGIQGGA